MKLAELYNDFIEKVAVVKEADGLPRIAGRITGLFLLHGGPFSFSEIAERLQVSRGSVSTNLRLIRDRGIVELVSRPGDRQDYYQLARNSYRSTLERALAQVDILEHLARETAKSLGSRKSAEYQNLMDMARFHAIAAEHVKAMLAAVTEEGR